MSELTASAIKKLKVTELKAELSKRGLAVKGKKDELAKRLTNAILEQGDDDSVPADVSAQSDTIDESDSQEANSQDEVSETSQADADDNPDADDNDNVEDKAESEMETNAEKEQEDSTNALDTEKTPTDDAKSDDWVMVEPPTKEEEKEVDQVITAQDAAQDAVVTPDAESSEQKAVTEDVDMKEPTDTKESADTKESEPATNGDVSVNVEKTEDAAAGQSTEKKEESEKAPVVEKKKPVETMAEVEVEDGEDTEFVEIEEGHVGLDGYTNDMHFIITDSGLGGHNLVKNGFSYMWAGARTNKGGKSGKIGYEIKVTKALDVELPEKEAPANAVRVGWSVETSGLQLGESALSYGYESTGKVCASSSFFAYGETFSEGDVIGTYLDLESETKTLRYTKNGVDLGVAMSLNLNLDEKPLFPHIFIRNMKIELNFGAQEEPWFPTLEGYSLLQNSGAENITDKTHLPPDSDEQCEILLMVGLPNSGKSTWAKKYVDAHPDKHFNIIGVNEVIERCKLEGKRRRKSDDGHDKLMQAVIQVLTKQYQLCPKKRRNYLYDQNNVYEVAQRTKMQSFEGFKKKAVVVVPTHDNLRRRASDARRKSDNIHDVPFGDLCDMKCEFHLPEAGDLFDEIVFPELDEKNASKTVRDYKSDGTRAKRTGRDEYYPSKRSRDDKSSRDRSHSGGYHRREEGWKSSGSGYGGGYKGRSNYGSSYGSGGYSNRNSGSQYQDPYRNRNSGSGGYRQHQSYGSSSNRGGSYGSSGYNSGSNYGSSGYGGSYGANNYGSSGYGATGANNYNYGNNYQQSSNTGAWNQYGSGQYGSTTQPQNNQWGSSNTTTNWGGYNYNSGSGNSYGGSGYSY